MGRWNFALFVATLAGSGCLLPNPSYDESGGGSDASGGGSAFAGTTTTDTAASADGSASSSTGVASGTGSGGVSATEPGGDATTGTSAATTGNATTDASSTDGAGSTTGVSFEPVTLQDYEESACMAGLICTKMGAPVSAFQRDIECFSAPVEPPFVVTRVGFDVRFASGQPSLTLRLYGFDPQVPFPQMTELGSAQLGSVGQMGYAEFTLQQPLPVDRRDFCVAIENSADTGFAVRVDQLTPGAHTAFYTMDAEGDGCDSPLIELSQRTMTPNAHFCIDVTIAPP